MSIAAHASAGGRHHPRRGRDLREPRAFLWSVSSAWLIFLVWMVMSQPGELSSHTSSLLPWVALLAVANLLPVPGWKSAHLAVDLPIGMAAGLVLSPIETGLVGFLGAFDTREFHGKLTIRKVMFNRSQIGCTYWAGSLAAHGLDASPSSSPWILPIAFLALTVIFVVNYLLVGTAISLEHGYPIRQVVRRMRLGTFEDFSLAFIAWGVLGAMLAALYDQVHPWALLAFLGPTLLSRQVLLRSQSFLDVSDAYRSRGAVLNRISHQIHEERSDERKLIAADLHDEVLQPLYKVQLMAHVLKGDLATGRLLEMDQDLPELLAAAELASGTLREFIGDLRRSTVGRGGLCRALTSLIRQLERHTPMSIHAQVQEVATDPKKELAVYQIAKEAIANAISHSRADNLWIELAEDHDLIRLLVRDDGIGFDPISGREGHFGIHIMRERAASVDGHLSIDSSPGGGSSLVLDVSAVTNSPPTR
jgi:signal transduction histidine kinase